MLSASSAAEPAELPAVIAATAPIMLVPAALALIGAPLATAFAGLALALIPLIGGLHLIAGLAGMPSMAHAAIAGLSAIAAQALALRLSLPPLSVPALAALSGLILGALLALPLCRLSPPHLAAASLALALLTAPLVAPTAGAVADLDAYLVGAGLALLALLLAQRLSTSLLGYGLRLARDRPELALSSGLDLLRLRRLAFAIGSALAGAGGGILALVPPLASEPFGVASGLALLAAIHIGGPGSLPGALVAALAVLLLPELVAVPLPAPVDLRLPVAALGVALTLALVPQAPGRS